MENESCINRIIAKCDSQTATVTERKIALYIKENLDKVLHCNLLELAELIGLKTVSRGVKIQFVDNQIVVDAIITVCYGCNIVNVAKEVQNSVTEAVQAITGIDKAEVNVHVSGVAFEK